MHSSFFHSGGVYDDYFGMPITVDMLCISFFYLFCDLAGEAGSLRGQLIESYIYCHITLSSYYMLVDIWT